MVYYSKHYPSVRRLPSFYYYLVLLPLLYWFSIVHPWAARHFMLSKAAWDTVYHYNFGVGCK
jgi:hypothetical protein